VRTARRNLVQRIDRFVKRIQTDGFQPGPDAIANFEMALECLERGDYPAGEDAMICGEYGFEPRFERLRASSVDGNLSTVATALDLRTL
jgi:hypothetical protein